MCVHYKGEAYSYGFELKVPVKGGGKREFSIAISKYREKTGDFSGFCLNNQLDVVSGEKMLYKAFFDIINNIVKITIKSEENCRPTSQCNAVRASKVKDPVFFKKFEERKKTGRTLEYYETLRDYLEKPVADIPQEKKPDIYDSPNILLFHSFLRDRKSDISNIEYFRL